MIAESTRPCAAHGQHRPFAQYQEEHHVIPKAWQAFWAPASGRSPAGSLLGVWDPRTEPLCPTGHRNVHWFLVRLMHNMPAAVLDPAPMDASLALIASIATVKSGCRAEQRVVNPSEFHIATLAIIRWGAAGGSVGDLILNKLWGEA